MITLTYNATVIDLPDDLLWVDEYRWSPVAPQETVTLDGALLVQAMAQQAGRPITLEGGSDYAWIKKNVLEALRVLEATPGAEMTLTIREDEYTVIFTGDRLRADPVWPIADPDDDQPYAVTLYLREV